MVANPYFARYPVMQVRPWGLLVYERTEWFIKPRKKVIEAAKTGLRRYQNNADGSVNGYSGMITAFSKKKLKRAIQLIVASSVWKEAPNFKTGKTFRFKVNFITLTLPCPQGEVTDKQIKKECLDNLIKRLKRKYKLNSYVWRAERQRNGNLHFHIITDCYIRYDHLRNDWNSVLNKFGYIDQFEKKHGHRNPNSTDIHSITNIKNLSQYFSKYMSKDELTQEAAKNIPFRNHSYKLPVESKKKIYWKECKTREQCKIDGKVWDCSTNLKNPKNCEMLLESDAENVWRETETNQEVRRLHNGMFSIMFLNDRQFSDHITGSVGVEWQNYLSMIRTPIGDVVKLPKATARSLCAEAATP